MPELVRQRVEAIFKDRQSWEPLWDVAYRYFAPERATIFHTEGRQPSDVQAEVFDATGIDCAERLVNLLISELIPPWQEWVRIDPGPEVTDAKEREELLPYLQDAGLQARALLEDSSFYDEMQACLLDRIVGGTAVISVEPDDSGLHFKDVPLSEAAIQEDAYGRVSAVARKTEWSTKSLMDVYKGKLPPTWKDQHKDALYKKHAVLEICERQSDGQWKWQRALGVNESTDSQETMLGEQTYPLPRLMATRWSKPPGSAYGRGPALRVLSDQRMLGKIKELSLKNAAMAVSGVYTVVNDGVVNAYTLTLEPGARIPVLTNNPNDPSIMPLGTATDFNVAMFSMDDLRNSIKTAFMADQFQPLGRTPQSATEIVERTRVIATDMGATIARLQREILTPSIQWALYWLRRHDKLAPELVVDNKLAKFRYVGRLAQAQWATEKSNMMQLASMAQAFGQVDKRAGFVVDSERALRRVAELDSLPTETIRSSEQIDELMGQQAAAAQAMAEAVPEGQQ